MAMTMKGDVLLPADRAVVWEKLNDPDVLKACIPGCEDLTRDGDDTFKARVKVKLGPVKATFNGKVRLTDVDPSRSYRISGEGEGGIAGFAKGAAFVRLDSVAEGETRLTYEVEASIGGKIAQLGSRLIDGVAKKYADAFFEAFRLSVSAP